MPGRVSTIPIPRRQARTADAISTQLPSRRCTARTDFRRLDVTHATHWISQTKSSPEHFVTTQDEKPSHWAIVYFWISLALSVAAVLLLITTFIQDPAAANRGGYLTSAIPGCPV